MTKRDDDVAFIEALARILADNDLGEIEVAREYGEDDSLEVRVSRQTASAPAPMAAPAPSAPAAAPSAAVPGPAPAPAAPEDPAQDPGAVTSPMVGTAYLAPEPGRRRKCLRRHLQVPSKGFRLHPAANRRAVVGDDELVRID